MNGFPFFKNTLICLFSSIILFSSCHQNKEDISHKNLSTKKVENRLEEKHVPSEEFFLQRASSDGTFAINAYSNALYEAKNQAQLRTITGFDKDWTTQGPGNIGARINSVAVNPLDENIIYAGFSDGGIFKTTDGGTTWNPIFDDQVFLTTGDIVLDPNDPNIVYVGTGDVNISGYPFIGDGLYRSMDGGETWTNLGLTDQRIISKVVIDPTNSNNIFAATMGLPFVRNNDRGLYRSTDNGNSWDQILFISDSTGVIDLLMDPQNPQVLYAAGWDRIRNNTESLTRGFGAKIYKSIDGGDTWNMLEGGLPNSEPHCRIGLTMYESNPDIIYAQYVGLNYQLEAIYKTENAGLTWDTIPTDENITGLSSTALGGFGWYFGKIRVNPNDADDIYLLGVDLWRTRDAGDTWARATPEWWTYNVHADKHDLVFLENGGVLLGTDGGLYKSDAENEVWEDIENIPATQFYRVAYNPHEPELYYGGAQDNGTTGGNADDINNWERIFGGDGFTTEFDPDNPDRFFTEYQNGNIRVTLDGGYYFDNATNGIDDSDRKNWDMPYFISSHNSEIMYTGTHKVYFSFGQIPEWAPISEDLTDGTAEQHRYHNISAICESPIVEGLLYVGTGDGNVWRTDNLTDWVSIENNLPDQYVTDIVASPSDENTVYVTYSGYRDNDFLPRIHRSIDRGESWEDISNNLPDLAINEIVIVPETNDSIIFVATDGGVYGTTTAGTEWERLGVNMPIITVYDLVINEAKDELVAGTFARSIMSYPLDSIVLGLNPTVSFDEVKKEKVSIKIYPNPTTDFIELDFQNKEIGKSSEIVILSVDGKLMYQSEKLLEEKINKRIDVSSFPSGQYFVKVKIRHQTISENFVKN